MEFLQAADTILPNIPAEHLFVDVAAENAPGEARKVRIFLDKSLGIENDRGLQILGGDLIEDRPTQLGDDLLLAEAQVQVDGGKTNTSHQLRPIPEEGGLILAGDNHHRGLAFRFTRDLRGFFQLVLAHESALGPVENIGLGHLVVTLLHQDLLHQVLHLFDVDERLARSEDRRRHLLRDLDGRRGIHLLGEKGLADSYFDLVGIPGDNLGTAADHPQLSHL